MRSCSIFIRLIKKVNLQWATKLAKRHSRGKKKSSSYITTSHADLMKDLRSLYSSNIRDRPTVLVTLAVPLPGRKNPGYETEIKNNGRHTSFLNELHTRLLLQDRKRTPCHKQKYTTTNSSWLQGGEVAPSKTFRVWYAFPLKICQVIILGVESQTICEI